jgi:hypothetical protein
MAEERKDQAMRVIERTEGHYEVQDVEFGTVYRWTSETVVVACDCGERQLLSSFATTCEACGADHAAVFRGESVARQPQDETLHPWRYAKDREDARMPF